MEHRQASDSPLTEADIELFNRFYVDFLGKRLDDPMSFLKVGTLLRRGDLRDVVRETMVLRTMFEQAIPNIRQRDLLLSFPGVLPNLHSMMFDLSQSYGAEGNTVQVMKRDQVEKHLDGTEMFRLDVDKAMEDFPSLPPDDRQALLQLMKTRPGESTLRFLLVILADHLFLVVLPSQTTETTPALGRLRQLIETQLGEKPMNSSSSFSPWAAATSGALAMGCPLAAAIHYLIPPTPRRKRRPSRCSSSGGRNTSSRWSNGFWPPKCRS
jgi:hypothetical protein